MFNDEHYMKMIQMSIHPGLLKGLLVDEEARSQRQELEYPSNIETTITDRDMLLVQIDHALDCGDAEQFMQLTEALKGMEVLI